MVRPNVPLDKPVRRLTHLVVVCHWEAPHVLPPQADDIILGLCANVGGKDPKL